LASTLEIDDAETSTTQAYFRISKYPELIRTTVTDHSQHLFQDVDFDRVIGSQVKDAGDSTHVKE
jgi:hypothetical protein